MNRDWFFIWLGVSGACASLAVLIDNTTAHALLSFPTGAVSGLLWLAGFTLGLSYRAKGVAK